MMELLQIAPNDSAAQVVVKSGAVFAVVYIAVRLADAYRHEAARAMQVVVAFASVGYLWRVVVGGFRVTLHMAYLIGVMFAAAYTVGVLAGIDLSTRFVTPALSTVFALSLVCVGTKFVKLKKGGV